MKTLSVVGIWLLQSCTLISNESGHVSVMPATPLCAFAQCENMFSDRADRAGTKNIDGSTTEVDQNATAKIQIPDGALK